MLDSDVSLTPNHPRYRFVSNQERLECWERRLARFPPGPFM